MLVRRQRIFRSCHLYGGYSASPGYYCINRRVELPVVGFTEESRCNINSGKQTEGQQATANSFNKRNELEEQLRELARHQGMKEGRHAFQTQQHCCRYRKPAQFRNLVTHGKIAVCSRQVGCGASRPVMYDDFAMRDVTEGCP
ncbi:unnamed protein product [Victoria cruziana]